MVLSGSLLPVGAVCGCGVTELLRLLVDMLRLKEILLGLGNCITHEMN